MKKIPRKSDLAWPLLRAVHAHGPFTIEHGMKIHGKLARNYTDTVSTYDRCVANGWLVEEHGVYSLTALMAVHLEECAPPAVPDNLTPPRQPAPFKPLSSKHIPSAKARRHDAQDREDHSFFYGSPAAEPIIRGISR